MFLKGIKLLKSHPRYLIFLIVAIILVEYGVIPVIKPLGFYCKDPKLSHKFEGDSVSVKLLLSVTILLPLPVLCIIEWASDKKAGSRWSLLKQAFVWYRDFLSGLLIVFTIVVYIKVIVGEPRPHFLDSCRPKEALNCSSEKYFPSYECMNKNASVHHLRDVSKSFPSGHAALSFYFFLYLAWFMQKKLRHLQPIVLVWLQTLLFLWAILCALSRIRDHRHHWWDVIAGTLIGSAVAFCTVKSISMEFKTTTEGSARHLSDGITNGNMFISGAECNSVRRVIAKINSYSVSQHHDIGLAAT